MTRYTVYNLADTSETVCNLTSREAIQYIYRDDGGDYALEPKLDIYMSDAAGNARQEIDSDGNLVFELWFKRSCNHKYLKSPLTVAGATEEDAENRLLDSAFELTRYDDTKWNIETDEEYIASIAKQRTEWELHDYK